MVLDALLSFVLSNLQVTLLFLIVFLVCFWWIRIPNNLPPGPFPLPIIGNLFKFFGKSNYEFFCHLAEEYGGIYTVYFGNIRVIVVSDLSIIKEAAVKQADTFSNRFLPPILEWTVQDHGSIVFQNGPAWKERRKFFMQAFRNFGVGKKSLEHKINEEARYMIKLFEEQEGKPFDPLQFTSYVIANVICHITFGKRFNYDDTDFQKIIQLLQTFNSSVSPGGILQVFPWLVRTPFFRHFADIMDALNDFVTVYLNDHKETLNEEDHRDIIDMYLSEIKRQQQSDEEVIFKPEEAWRAIGELFSAGSDSTTNTLLFAILLSVVNPDVQDKVQEEIDRVIGSNRQPSYEDRLTMPYCEAVLMEVQRFKPVAPLTPPHGVFKDALLAGYYIPKGTHVFFNLCAVLHDPKVWKNPKSFDPSNFLSEDGKSVIKPENFIPFGIGRRICIGEHLAKMELFLFYTNLMQRFKFSIPEGDPTPSLVPIVGILGKPVPFRICATPRG
ncbi:Cytochrome P450 2U1 [Holothuria leucospilota]|uniref:Cytochrome P450 2U1 n=1 Tax=Holothuria leucospilota TaxID=206669 RepID=A0A9Q1CK25_HOLLE|nr:Cytochrome P450 2U1 [Holothuria leucospilota]